MFTIISRKVLVIFSAGILAACASEKPDYCDLPLSHRMGQGASMGGVYGAGPGIVIALVMDLFCPHGGSETGPRAQVTLTDAQLKILEEAHSGEASAQFEVAQIQELPPALRWNWACLAAHQNHADAQKFMAVSYRMGAGVGKDLVESYKWMLLSLKTGAEDSEDEQSQAFRRAYLEEIGGELSETNISKAQSMFIQWQPNPAECKISPDAWSRS